MRPSPGEPSHWGRSKELNASWVYVRQCLNGDGFDEAAGSWQAYYVTIDSWTNNEPSQWFSEAPLTWEAACALARDFTAREAEARVVAELASETYRLRGVGGQEAALSQEMYGEWDAAVTPEGEALPAAVGDLLVEVTYSFAALPKSFSAPIGWSSDLRPPLLGATGDERSGTVTVQVADRQTGWEGQWAQLAVLHALSSPPGGLRVAPRLTNSLDSEDENPDAFG